MSRLSRLRSWWRSRFRRQVTAHGFAAHRAMNLLPPVRLPGWSALLPSLKDQVAAELSEEWKAGQPRERGSWVLSASTGTKEPGTRTPETGTTGGCSSYSEPGAAWVDERGRIWYRPASSCFGPIVYGLGTAAPGESSAPGERAG